MEKSIAFMFDIAGTLDDITNDTAKSLFERIEILRKKYEADKVYITISTLYDETYDIKFLCRELEPFVKDHIEFGLHFYSDGSYDYLNDVTTSLGFNYNHDKMKIFYDHYVINGEGNQFVACFDDSFDPKRYLEYQSKHPLLCGIPYNFYKRIEVKNNLMCMKSTNPGVKGIIEILDEYISRIKDIDINNIIDEQIKMPLNFTENEVKELIWNFRYDNIINFIKYNKLSDNMYKVILESLLSISSKVTLKDEEKEYIEYITDALINHYENINDDFSIERVKNFERSLK